jgi:hypothetical protein
MKYQLQPLYCHSVQTDGFRIFLRSLCKRAFCDATISLLQNSRQKKASKTWQLTSFNDLFWRIRTLKKKKLSNFQCLKLRSYLFFPGFSRTLLVEIWIFSLNMSCQVVLFRHIYILFTVARMMLPLFRLYCSWNTFLLFFYLPLLSFAFVSHGFYLRSEQFHIKHTSLKTNTSQTFSNDTTQNIKIIITR